MLSYKMSHAFYFNSRFTYENFFKCILRVMFKKYLSKFPSHELTVHKYTNKLFIKIFKKL